MTTPKVLLVDDVRVFLEFERSFFERAGCDILTASTGPEALRLARSQKPHVILLDFEMPGMNGDEVCRSIREDPLTRHIPVLIVTSHHRPEVIERSRRAGCTDLLFKPVSGGDLLNHVLRVLSIPYRVEVRCRVTLDAADGPAGESKSLIGYAQNVSEGGILVSLPEPLDAGATVRLGFRLSEEAPSLNVMAEIVRVERTDGDGLFIAAIQFKESEAEARAAVQRFVERALAG